MFWAERTDGRKNLFKREKNLPVVILSFREQTLTNIIQGVRNHLTWEKEPAHPPARRAETSPQEANSKETYPKVKGNNIATATHCEATAAGAATKHQRMNTPAVRLLHCTAAARRDASSKGTRSAKRTRKEP